MSIENKDVCASCDILKTEYPEFLANGLTDEMCVNLQNNKGLDPEKCVDNCEVLHNMADCLVGGLIENINNYDTCDTREMMTNFAVNLLNLIDALICSHCGQWEQIEALWNEIITSGKTLPTVTDKGDGVVEIDYFSEE